MLRLCLPKSIETKMMRTSWKRASSSMEDQPPSGSWLMAPVFFHVTPSAHLSAHLIYIYIYRVVSKIRWFTVQRPATTVDFRL